MAVNNLVKRLQNVMRSDAGISGDAQRIEQMTWLFFLKVYDAQEDEWAFKNGSFQSIIPEDLRWRNWAVDKKDGSALTGDSLLEFVNNKLFPTLQQLPLLPSSPRAHWIVKEVFADLNQYMKNGVLLRQVINIVDEIDFTDAEDRHTFGDIYEGILKDLQSAGHAGEFYTPRALTDFIIETLNPRLGESLADYTSGTGGFLTSALNYLATQRKTPQDEELWQNSVHGQEWKPLPYLLSITNLLVHGVDEPDIIHCDSLGTPVSSFREKDKVDVIAMNPPYGGSTEASAKMNFPADMRSSETADLFMVLIMRRLKAGGRAGVIIPDGFLFGTDGAKLAIKTALLRDYNVHTIIRLPGSIFAPYTGITTNIVFFNNETAEGAPEGYKTKEVWFYRLDMPEGYKHFSKTKPMKIEHCQPIRDWWFNRQEIFSKDEEGNVIDEKSRCFSVQDLVELSCNFDQCKFPLSDNEVLSPSELLADYNKHREELDKQINVTINGIENLLKGGNGSSLIHVSAKVFDDLAELQRTFPERLRQSILQEAISGHLVPQDPKEEEASILLNKINKQRELLVKTGAIEKRYGKTLSIDESEYDIELPQGWVICKLGNIAKIFAGGTPARGVPKFWNGGNIPWLKIADITSSGKYVNSASEYITEEGMKNSSAKLMKKGTLLYTIFASIGEVGILNFEATCNQAIANIDLYEPAMTDYIYYYLKNLQAYMYSISKGCAQLNINQEILKNAIVPLPPLEEQKRIVAKIEELFAAIKF